MLAMRILEIEFSCIFNTKPQTAKVQENSNFPNFLEQTLDYNSDIVHFLFLFWKCLKLPHFLREIQNSVNKKWTLSDF